MDLPADFENWLLGRGVMDASSLTPQELRMWQAAYDAERRLASKRRTQPAPGDIRGW